MSRLKSVSNEAATGDAISLFETVVKKMGKVPNMARVMAVQPAVLDAYLLFSSALGKGAFDAKTREAIALMVASRNGCDYCAAAHGFVSKSLKVDASEIDRNLGGVSADTRKGAILSFASVVIDTRGKVSESDLEIARAEGIDDATIVEIIANVALNTFTNLINNVAETDIDFPEVTMRRPHFAV